MSGLRVVGIGLVEMQLPSGSVMSLFESWTGLRYARTRCGETTYVSH